MRGDSYVLNELPEELVADWYAGKIFTEHDMQSCAYFHLRRMFDRDRSDTWLLRNQPQLSLGGAKFIKPDFGLFKKAKLYDIYEMKCLLGVDLTSGDVARIESDLEKIQAVSRKLDLRHAYFLLLCDDDLGFRFDRRKNDWSHGLLTVVVANVYRHHGSGRMRRGYDGIRRRWETWKGKHRNSLPSAEDQ